MSDSIGKDVSSCAEYQGEVLYCAAQLSPDLAGLAWIQYMRWARRADSVNASRKLFVKARKWPQCSWQVRSMHSVLVF